MKLIDTHTHLYDESFSEDFDQMIQRAKDVGVCKVILPGIDISAFDSMIKCAERLPGFAYPAIGLHPTSVKEDWREELDFVIDNIDKYSFCAVGEIGIDGYWSKTFIEEQKIIFHEQLLMAAERNLPVIIHLRDSTDEIFEVLDKVVKSGIKNLKGVFHAFSGSWETYTRIKRYGDFKIGIGGVVTFKNASIATTLERVPLEDIILETDAPWLTPAPFRGKRNESSYIIYIAEKIASIKNIPVETLSQITTLNATTLFGLN